MAPDGLSESVPLNNICKHKLRRFSFKDMMSLLGSVPSTFTSTLQAALKRRLILLIDVKVAEMQVKRGGYI